MKKALRTILLLLLPLLAACGKQEGGGTVPPAPDYADATYWYELSAPDRAVDIFYVYPTVGTVPTDEHGNVLEYTNVDQPREREAAVANQRFNREAYAAGRFNFFAPYYRQITMAVYEAGPEAVEARSDIPRGDIRRAFDYYMEHLNGGRPFLLLGHSQGSAVLIDLLKHGMSEARRSRMVAAYLIGYQITREELGRYPDRLRPATGPDDTGVIVLYNSLTDPAARSPLMDRSAVCINPLNWRTDGTPASRAEHRGIIRYNPGTDSYDEVPGYTTGARIEDHYLICDDIDPRECYAEEYRELFPLGNLHFMDSWLYAVNLRENMVLRSEAFLSSTQR